jgi:HEPN domain-containing protein
MLPSEMANRAQDWLAQAERDLRHAERSRSAGEHEWACFAAHQAAEKAVKALHLHLGQEAWGHVVARLLSELPVSVPEGLVERARVLDNFYVPSRYPNSHTEGAPFEHYGPLQSEEAIAHAGAILGFVRSQMA